MITRNFSISLFEKHALIVLFTLLVLRLYVIKLLLSLSISKRKHHILFRSLCVQVCITRNVNSFLLTTQFIVLMMKNSKIRLLFGSLCREIQNLTILKINARRDMVIKYFFSYYRTVK